MSRRLWKSFSWISSGWRRTLKLWHGGCSMHNCTSFCCPFRELVNLGSAAFAKAKVKPRIAAELFALLGVLVSSGPVCVFHLSFLNCLWAVCNYLLQNDIHLNANHLQKQWVLFLLRRYTNGEKNPVWNSLLLLNNWKVLTQWNKERSATGAFAGCWFVSYLLLVDRGYLNVVRS